MAGLDLPLLESLRRGLDVDEGLFPVELRQALLDGQDAAAPVENRPFTLRFRSRVREGDFMSTRLPARNPPLKRILLPVPGRCSATPL
jgi:hypothetical protein